MYIILIISGCLLLSQYWIFKSLSNFEQLNDIISGIAIMQKWLEQESDTSTKYFFPCSQGQHADRNCGYELGISKDDMYCLNSDVYKIQHPDVVLRDAYVFREYGVQDLARQIIMSRLFDPHSNFTQTSPLAKEEYINLSIQTTIIYSYAKNLFKTHILGKQVGCLFQKYFHVPGQEELALKSLHSLNYKNYQNSLKNQNKSEQCLKEAQFQQKTFRMWDKEECESFFNLLNSQDYKQQLQNEGLQYIYKNNKHLGKGIMLLDQNNEKLVRQQYNEGRFCGSNTQNVIIQKYLKNPLLYKGHKLEFRSYFLIASTNPPILFGYKNTLIKQCAVKFDLKSFTFESHVCNTAVTQKSNKQNSEEYYIDWNLEGLQDLLLQEGRINNKNWLEEYLYPQIYVKLQHLYNSAAEHLFKDSRVGEFFGIDFILDQNLDLWIFECNRNPNFLAVTEGRKIKFNKLLDDLFQIQFLLVRNRFIRIRKFLLQTLLPALRNKDFHMKRELLKHQFLIEFQDKIDFHDELKNNMAVLILQNTTKSQCL